MNQIRHRDLLSHLHHADTTTLWSSAISDDSAKQVAARAEDRLRRLLDNYHPWLGHTEEERQTTEAKSLVHGWSRSFGDPRDPEVAARIAAVAAALNRRAAETRTPPPSARSGVFNRHSASWLDPADR